MIKFIKRIMDERKKQKEQALFFKRQAIQRQVTKFYEDLAISSGKTFLPPFVAAKQALCEYVRTDKDVERIYKKMVKWQFEKLAAKGV